MKKYYVKLKNGYLIYISPYSEDEGVVQVETDLDYDTIIEWDGGLLIEEGILKKNDNYLITTVDDNYWSLIPNIKNSRCQFYKNKFLKKDEIIIKLLKDRKEVSIFYDEHGIFYNPEDLEVINDGGYHFDEFIQI